MVKTLISAFPDFKKEVPKDKPYLRISEHFGDTIQGENFVGVPSAFLRLQRCTLNCKWCDTTEVWRKGNPYSIDEVLDLWEQEDMVTRFKDGQHLILTGGSPLLQQDSLIKLIDGFEERYNFKPYIEIENECTLMPKPEMLAKVDLWNNSPKLANSGMSEKLRYKPEILETLGKLDNSYFKFVVQDEKEWQEIDKYFLQPGYIKKDKIVVMPEGQTREELQNHYETTANLAVKYNVRMTDRFHVTIWDKKTGV